MRAALGRFQIGYARSFEPGRPISELGQKRYRRKQTSASAAAMTDPDPNPFADCDVGASPHGTDRSSGFRVSGRAQK
jgi:hypothetical protein